MSIPDEICFSIKSFDFMHGIMLVPIQSIWYRAYSSTNRLTMTSDPLFFGDMEVAWLNAQQPDRKLGEFKCLQPLRLLDMRYVMAILPFLLKNTDASSIEMLSISLGLCSFTKQIELLDKLYRSDSAAYPSLLQSIQRMRDFEQLPNKPIWVNPIETRGVRVGITPVDYRVMFWLKDLFGKVADGIIAPAFPSPFHDQGSSDIQKSIMYQELIIFNPKQTLKHVHDHVVTTKIIYHHLTVPIGDAYLHQVYTKLLLPENRMTGMTGMTGGSLNKDEISQAMKEAVKRERQAWLPYIRQIQKSQEFLQHTHVTFKALSPPKVMPSGTPVH